MHAIFKKIGFFTAFIIPALVITGFYAGGLWNYLAVIFAFLIIPFIDQLSGVNTTNIPSEQVSQRGEEFYYRFITYIWTFLQLILLVWGAFAVTSGALQNITEWMGFVMSFALATGGIGITVAHELGHKKSALERFYSQLLLMTVCYMHFYIEHNRGHHVLVATPEDPATARKNETFYAFWVRSVFGGYIHAWKIEAERLRRKGYKIISVRNEMIWYFLLPLAFCALLTILTSWYNNYFTWQVPVFFFSQSFIAFTLLELVNYIEHYGIQRKQLPSGQYERVNPLHSWNANHILSNFFLFQLQRHSDHHAFAYKRYQVLNHYDESPQLPYGYPTMIIIALAPTIWFRIMNKRLEQWSHNTPTA